jgi:branched-chain amino acid transport system permease protein
MNVKLQSKKPISIGIVFVLLLFVLFAIFPLIIKNPYNLNLLIMILLMGYFATAWGLVGQTGQLSFGHVAYIGIGAYTSTILFQQYGISPWIGMIAGGLAAVFFGAIIGYPTLRLRGVYFALATLAFAFILKIFVMNTYEVGPFWLGASPGIAINIDKTSSPIVVFQFLSKVPYYYIMFIMLVGVIGLNFAINRSRMGYYWAAIRDDTDAAESLGINVSNYRIRAFLLSCFLTGMGGVFYAQYILAVDPKRVLDLGFSIEIALIGIVGGWQSVLGPFLGALILTPVGELIRARLHNLPQLYIIIYGAILIAFILFLPNGINSKVMKLVGAIDSRRRAVRVKKGSRKER